MKALKIEVKNHLEEKIIPFWKSLRDNEYGGYYGLLDFDLKLDKKAVKGCILNSRILWFFSNAYITLKDEHLLDEAHHAYEFLKNYCVDSEYGGVYWAVNYDGSINDDLKHTYNQAFAIYALSTYYDASENEDALREAFKLYNLIENTCRDAGGYLEAFERDFTPMESNENLSENGINAQRTMNTLLHIFEAYCELYRVSKNEAVAQKIRWILDIFSSKIYNPQKSRQEVFFDKDYNSLIDLHSYGHDIETAWLIDRGCEILGDSALCKKMQTITSALAEKVYERAYIDHSLPYEGENDIDDTRRAWWVQAETVLGFLNEWEKTGNEKYRLAAYDVWEYIKENIVDKREGSEWFSEVDKNRKPIEGKPIVEPWKCPYHNGRMCMEIIRRVK